jgi:putative ABC transport system substrate-binding protein
MRRREFITLVGGGAIAWPLTLRAQQPARPLVAVLSPLSARAAAPNVEALRQGLHDLGYAEGRNLAFALRFANGDSGAATAMATEVVALKSDVIVAGAATVIEAHKATHDIPIVMVAMSGDPLKLGLVQSLARPGGNVTGLLFYALTASGSVGLTGKRLALLAELSPRPKRVGVMVNPNDAQDALSFEAMPEAARDLHLDYRLYEVREAGELDAAFAALARDGVDAILMSGSPLFNLHRARVAEKIAASGRPSIGTIREQAVEGSLMAYGPSIPQTYRRASRYVAKILEGTRAAELPIEQPTEFDLIINLKTAKALGLTVPSKLLARADEVIE